MAADLEAVFFAVEADLDLVSFAAPLPLPVILEGVDLPLLPAFADDLLADELPPVADFRLPPAEPPLADLLLPLDEPDLLLLVLLPLDEALRLPLLDEPPVADFLLPALELLLAADVLLPLVAEPAFLLPLELREDAVFDPPLDEPLLVLRLLVELPPLLLPLDAVFFVPLVEPLLLLLLPDALLDPLLAVELEDEDFRLDELPLLPVVLLFLLPLDEPPDAVDLVFVDTPPITALTAESVAPTTAPVAAPATISPTTSFALS